MVRAHSGVAGSLSASGIGWAAEPWSGRVRALLENESNPGSPGCTGARRARLRTRRDTICPPAETPRSVLPQRVYPHESLDSIRHACCSAAKRASSTVAGAAPAASMVFCAANPRYACPRYAKWSATWRRRKRFMSKPRAAGEATELCSLDRSLSEAGRMSGLGPCAIVAASPTGGELRLRLPEVAMSGRTNRARDALKESSPARV